MLATFGLTPKTPLEALTPRQILALAIGAEEEDGRIYAAMAARVQADFPASAKVFRAMAAEENTHRQQLLALHKTKFGNEIELIRREDVAGFSRTPPLWLDAGISAEKLWQLAEEMEAQAARFYALAAERAGDADVRKLLGDLAAAEQAHQNTAEGLQVEHLTEGAKGAEAATAHKNTVLQVVQPGLAGLIDGSVSTLAPLFAAAMATGSSHATLMVGLAASVGAGISMGLTEGMSDDGKISGRGSPWLRGTVCGMATFFGGVFHALPYALADFHTATALAVAVVVAELLAIAYIRYKYMHNPLIPTLVQIVLGGALVVAAGFVLGSS